MDGIRGVQKHTKPKSLQQFDKHLVGIGTRQLGIQNKHENEPESNYKKAPRQENVLRLCCCVHHQGQPAAVEARGR
jgi:hypothetical protein